MEKEKKLYSFARVGEIIIRDGWGNRVYDIREHIKNTDNKELAFYVLCFLAEKLKALEGLEGLKYIAQREKEKREKEFEALFSERIKGLLAKYEGMSKSLRDFIAYKTERKYYFDARKEYLESDRGCAWLYLDHLIKLEGPTKSNKLYGEWIEAKKKAKAGKKKE